MSQNRAKLHLGRIRSRLLSQAEIVASIERLIGEGRLNRLTLRPTRDPPPSQLRGLNRKGFALGDGEPGPPLFDALVAEAKRRGLPLKQVSNELFGVKSSIYRLRSNPTCRRATADRVRHWLEQSASMPGGHAPAGRGRSAIAAASLVAEIDAFLAATGMSASRFGVHCLPGKSRLTYMRRPGATVKPATVERVRAFIANYRATHEPSGAESQAPENPSVAAPPITGPSCAALADAIDALIAAHDLSRTRVGTHLFNTSSGIARLRKGTRRPARKTVERVQAFLRDPPLSDFRRKREREAPDPTSARQRKLRRDATERPDTPLMDLAERQRANGLRYRAAIRRGQEQEAAARLDAYKPPRNGFERNLMSEVERRRAEEARQKDPVEQAKLALQRKGRVVHSASIHGGRSGFFMVGGQRDPRTGRLREISPGELLDLAERVTGQSFRRSA